MTALCFDFGMKSIGVAIGNPVTTTATPLSAITAVEGAPNWQQVAELVTDWKPQALIVGLPLNMDGTEQPITSEARLFGEKLQGRFGLPVHFVDERLSTVEAKARLFELGGAKKLTKSKIDSVSACLIYESYINRHSNKDDR